MRRRGISHYHFRKSDYIISLLSFRVREIEKNHTSAFINFRLPFNANDSKTLYAMIYFLCTVTSFIIASSNVVADGFYLGACMHINVMLEHFHDKIESLNNALIGSE